MSNDPVTLTRDVEAAVVPVGTKVTLMKGETAYITQSLGGSYTVVVNGNMFRLADKDADALGLEVVKLTTATLSGPVTQEALEKQVWESLKTCYDPEIPRQRRGPRVDLRLSPHAHRREQLQGRREDDFDRARVRHGPVLAQDVQNKLISLEPIDEANVELVWDPPWNQGMMTEAAKLQLGLM